MRKLIIIVLLLANFQKNYAQNNAIFQGGNQDGATTTKITQTSNNIYLGGVNDGTGNQKYTQATNNIFVGNTGDGQSSIIYIQSANSIFAGGNSDGWAETNFLQTGNSIFAGGDADGWSETNFLQVGNSIFAGGNSDGWAEAYYKPMAPLPVKFISFNVVKKENAFSLLTWKTATESNSDFFEIQRGTDALQFSTIGKVISNNNSTETIEYYFTDNAPLKGLNYYRLKQVDLDGKYTFTPARALNFENIETNSVKYYPNPTHGILNIEMDDSINENIIINVFNAAGIVVNHLKINNLKKNTIAIDLSNYPKGIYFIHLKSQTINSTHRVVLQ